MSPVTFATAAELRVLSEALARHWAMAAVVDSGIIDHMRAKVEIELAARLSAREREERT